MASHNKWIVWCGIWMVIWSCVADELHMYSAEPGVKRVCPKGFYCSNLKKVPCPAGSFNDKLGRNSCTPCGSASECPRGSILPRKGKPTSFEPTKLRNNIAVATPSPTETIRNCPRGHYCVENAAEPLPCGGGYYGKSSHNRNARCDGLCPEGFFCPPGTENPIPCPDDPRLFCPAGASSPVDIEPGRYVKDNREVITERGYRVDENGVRSPCPAGFFGDQLGETRENCTGTCAGGYFCPEASVSAFEIKCSAADEYCPLGSGYPLKIDPGFYKSPDGSSQILCPVGHYCTGGKMLACPAGTVNLNRTGLASLNECEVCPHGMFCFKNRMSKCGKVSLYCPQGEAFSPLNVTEGHYTLSQTPSFQSTLSECSFSEPRCLRFEYNSLYLPEPTVLDDPTTRSMEKPCEPGHYCQKGERFECPPGTFGSSFGLSNAECSGRCAAGSFCPAKSTSENQFECPKAHFCPAGVGSPFPVHRGYYVPVEKNRQIICPKGHYCIDGVLEVCQAGKFGDIEGLSSPECSGPCPPGFYCPQGTASPIEQSCSNSDSFCPIGTEKPIDVLPGYYSNAQRTWQYPCEPGYFCRNGIKQPCPSGRYGATFGLSSPDCSGPCKSGYFCLAGATNDTMYECKDAFGLTRDGQTFLSNDVKDRTCLAYLFNVYPEQFFEFSLLRERQELDPTLWNLAFEKEGLYAVQNTMRWNNTMKAFQSSGQNDQEFMATGWRPSSGNKTMCMWKMFLTDNIYGLDGMQRQYNTNDYFMIGTFWSHRSQIFVSSGADRGGYASERVEIQKHEWVFYCLTSGGAGSTSEAYVATPNNKLTKVWEQSNNGADRGILASSPHLSMIYGRTSTGETDRPLYHSPGRQAYSDALYGGILHWNAHLAEEDILNAYQVTSYFYPPRGSRTPEELECGAYPSQEWAQGHLGRNIGPVPSIYFKKNRFGVYEPRSNPVKQFQYEETLVPFFPRVLGNSEAAIYCPEGSGKPLFSDLGYYTVNGTDQVQCEPGFYCVNGVRRACDPGVYGSEPGLFKATCTGQCPAGYMCPEGTTEPIECPEGHYSVGGSSSCTSCGLSQGSTPRCKSSRLCCQVGPESDGV